MTEFTRRDLLGGAAAVAASTLFNNPAHAQYVWEKADWHAADFEALARVQKRIKYVIHANAINGGRFLANTKNALNGIHFGSGIPLDQIQIACALNVQANILNYSDYIWEKYKVGEWLKLDDPTTGKPLVRNYLYPSRFGTVPHYTSQDPSNENSEAQDVSIQALQARGVKFISCHTSTEEAARALVKQNGLSVEPEEVAKDMVAHALPGVLIVPSVAGALAMLQCEGHFAYMAA